MKQRTFITLCIISLISCSCIRLFKKDESDFRKEITNKAGSAAFNCGDYELRGERAPVDQCVTEHFKSAQAFYATYQSQGIDSTIKTGVVFNRQNELYLIFYDSNPYGGSGIDASITTQLCESPQIATVQDGDRRTPFECQNIAR